MCGEESVRGEKPLRGERLQPLRGKVSAEVFAICMNEKGAEIFGALFYSS